jgi:hypothetical protein
MPPYCPVWARRSIVRLSFCPGQNSSPSLPSRPGCIVLVHTQCIPVCSARPKRGLSHYFLAVIVLHSLRHYGIFKVRSFRRFPPAPSFLHLLVPICCTYFSIMPSVSSNDTPLLPLFSSPRPAPAPNGPASVRSHHSSPPPEGFVVPQIPPPNCPFRVTRDTHGHRRLPLVSENPLPVDHERVMKLIKYRVDVCPALFSSSAPY